MASQELKDQLIKHIDEALAMEKSVLRMLDGMISSTDDEEIRSELRHHKLETEQHAERLEKRLAAHEAAPETCRAAVAGESGIDWIRAFDADGLPVRVAAEVKDFDPAGLAPPKELRRFDRNVVLALGAAKEAVADAGLNGFDPYRVGIVF